MYLLDSVTPSKRRGHARRMLRASACALVVMATTLALTFATLHAMSEQERIDREHALARCAAYPVVCGKGPRP